MDDPLTAATDAGGPGPYTVKFLGHTFSVVGLIYMRTLLARCHVFRFKNRRKSDTINARQLIGRVFQKYFLVGTIKKVITFQRGIGRTGTFIFYSYEFKGYVPKLIPT